MWALGHKSAVGFGDNSRDVKVLHRGASPPASPSVNLQASGEPLAGTAGPSEPGEPRDQRALGAHPAEWGRIATSSAQPSNSQVRAEKSGRRDVTAPVFANRR